MSYEIKRLPASLIQRGDLIIESERPLSRIVHRKDSRDVVVWRDGDGEQPWDVLAQDRRITVFRVTPSHEVERERVARFLAERDHGSPIGDGPVCGGYKDEADCLLAAARGASPEQPERWTTTGRLDTGTGRGEWARGDEREWTDDLNRAEKDAAALNAIAAERASREDRRRERSIRLWGHPGAWCKPYPMTVEEIALTAVRAAESHDEVERLGENAHPEDIEINERLIDRLREHEAEVKRLRDALKDIAGDYGCGLLEPADVSEPAREGEPCRDRWPDDPSRWCVLCVASAALAATQGGDDV